MPNLSLFAFFSRMYVYFKGQCIILFDSYSTASYYTFHRCVFGLRTPCRFHCEDVRYGTFSLFSSGLVSTLNKCYEPVAKPDSIDSMSQAFKMQFVNTVIYAGKSTVPLRNTVTAFSS